MDPSLNHSWETSDSPKTFVFMSGPRIYAAGGIVRIAPTIALSTPKPRKSLRVMGSLCSSANLYIPSRKSLELFAEPCWRGLVLHRVVRLIIYGVWHPRIRLHEAHIERGHRCQDPQSQQDYPITRCRTTVPEAHPSPQVAHERPRQRRHQPEELYGAPTRAVRVPPGPYVHRQVRQHEEPHDQH